MRVVTTFELRCIWWGYVTFIRILIFLVSPSVPLGCWARNPGTAGYGEGLPKNVRGELIYRRLVLHWFSLNLAIVYQAVSKAAWITGPILEMRQAPRPAWPMEEKAYLAPGKRLQQNCGKSQQVFSSASSFLFLILLPEG